MAPTEGRVTRPERRLDCRRGTPIITMWKGDIWIITNRKQQKSFRTKSSCVKFHSRLPIRTYLALTLLKTYPANLKLTTLVSLLYPTRYKAKETVYELHDVITFKKTADRQTDRQTEGQTHIDRHVDWQQSSLLTLWRLLLPYGYSCKASCVRPG